MNAWRDACVIFVKACTRLFLLYCVWPVQSVWWSYPSWSLIRWCCTCVACGLVPTPCWPCVQPLLFGKSTLAGCRLQQTAATCPLCLVPWCKAVSHLLLVYTWLVSCLPSAEPATYTYSHHLPCHHRWSVPASTHCCSVVPGAGGGPLQQVRPLCELVVDLHACVRHNVWMYLSGLGASMPSAF